MGSYGKSRKKKQENQENYGELENKYHCPPDAVVASSFFF